MLLATVIAVAVVVLWSRLRAPGWQALRNRPLAAGGALACIGVLSLALSGTLIDVARGHDDSSYPEGADGYLGALYEPPPGDVTQRPSALRLTLRRLVGDAGPYEIVARGTLMLEHQLSAASFHASHTTLVDADGARVAGCDDAGVEAFDWPPQPDTAGGNSWGLIVDFPPGCPVFAGEYQESSPLPEPDALAAWRP